VKLHIGIDDTDSAKGGCTTYIAALLVEKLSRMRIRFIDYPNIIRLNPNVPYKTRGNAAVALRLEASDTDYDEVREVSIQTVEEYSRIGEEGTDPAIVFLRGKPSSAVARLSRRALTEIVSVRDAIGALRNSSASAVSYGSGLGLVGSLAAVGNALERDHTYELIAYRRRRNLGKPRRVDEESVIRMDRLTSPGTFNNYDAMNKRVLIKPHGPDPVLIGLRGETPGAVYRAFRLLRCREAIERWVIFRTNHGTDAHFRHGAPHTLRPNSPAVLRGVVHKMPIRISGGHVFCELQTSSGVVQCAAFEPTGKFKEVVARLIPGDHVMVFGGAKQHDQLPMTVNLEKLIIEHLSEDSVARNPRCLRCEKRMKSAGRGQGYRCPRCGYSSSKISKRFVKRERNLLTGLYVPDRKAHRHLTKPLSRYGLEKRRWDGKMPSVWHRP